MSVREKSGDVTGLFVEDSEPDSVATASSEDGDDAIDGATPIEKILHEAPENGVPKYLAKWIGLPLGQALYVFADQISGGDVLQRWEREKAEIKAGRRKPFNVRHWQIAYEDFHNAKDRRQERRLAKRERRKKHALSPARNLTHANIVGRHREASPELPIEAMQIDRKVKETRKASAREEWFPSTVKDATKEQRFPATTRRARAIPRLPSDDDEEDEDADTSSDDDEMDTSVTSPGEITDPSRRDSYASSIGEEIVLASRRKSTVGDRSAAALTQTRDPISPSGSNLGSKRGSEPTIFPAALKRRRTLDMLEKDLQENDARIAELSHIATPSHHARLDHIAKADHTVKPGHGGTLVQNATPDRVFQPDKNTNPQDIAKPSKIAQRDESTRRDSIATPPRFSTSDQVVRGGASTPATAMSPASTTPTASLSQMTIQSKAKTGTENNWPKTTEAKQDIARAATTTPFQSASTVAKPRDITSAPFATKPPSRRRHSANKVTENNSSGTLFPNISMRYAHQRASQIEPDPDPRMLTIVDPKTGDIKSLPPTDEIHEAYRRRSPDRRRSQVRDSSPPGTNTPGLPTNVWTQERVRPTRRPCRDWQAGSCSFGADCRYSHSLENNTKAIICPWWARGECRHRESSCGWAHVKSDRLYRLTCWYWANDTCSKTAESCPYAHEHTGFMGPVPTRVSDKDRFLSNRIPSQPAGQSPPPPPPRPVVRAQQTSRPLKASQTSNAKEDAEKTVLTSRSPPAIAPINSTTASTAPGNVTASTATGTSSSSTVSNPSKSVAIASSNDSTVPVAPVSANAASTPVKSTTGAKGSMKPPTTPAPTQNPETYSLSRNTTASPQTPRVKTNLAGDTTLMISAMSINHNQSAWHESPVESKSERSPAHDLRLIGRTMKENTPQAGASSTPNENALQRWNAKSTSEIVSKLSAPPPLPVSVRSRVITNESRTDRASTGLKSAMRVTFIDEQIEQDIPRKAAIDSIRDSRILNAYLSHEAGHKAAWILAHGRSNQADLVLLVFPAERMPELKRLKDWFRSKSCKVYQAHDECERELFKSFAAKHEPLIVVHPDEKYLGTTPELAMLLNLSSLQVISMGVSAGEKRKAEREGREPVYSCRYVFPKGSEILFITDDVFVYYPEKAEAIINVMRQRIERHRERGVPNVFQKIGARPGIKEWLAKLAGDKYVEQMHLHKGQSSAIDSRWADVVCAMDGLCPVEDEEVSMYGLYFVPSDSSQLVSSDPKEYSDFLDLWEKDQIASTDRLVEIFAECALANESQCRHFNVIHARPPEKAAGPNARGESSEDAKQAEKERMQGWKGKWNHLQVFEPDKVLHK